MKSSLLNINAKSVLDWKSVLLIIFVLVLAFMQCNQSEHENNTTITIDKKKYNLIKKSTGVTYNRTELKEYRTKEELYSILVEYDTLVQYKDVDTAAILRDYFAKRLTIDTLKLNDSLGFVVVTDTIKENRIWYRTYQASITQKEVHDTNWIAPVPTSKMYIGINGGFTKTQLPNTIGLSLMYQTPTDKIFGIGVGLQNGATIMPYVNGSVYWKIKLKK